MKVAILFTVFVVGYASAGIVNNAVNSVVNTAVRLSLNRAVSKGLLSLDVVDRIMVTFGMNIFLNRF